MLNRFFVSFFHPLVRSVIGLRRIKYGKTLSDKLNIFCWYILLCRNPYSLREILSPISQIIEHLSSTLCERTFFTDNDITFILAEMRDIWILDESFEPWMREYLKVREGEVFLDVGAHIGKYTLQLARVVGKSGLVIAVEPHPRNYDVLMRNIRENNFENIIALNIAAWNYDGEIELFPGKSSGLHSVKRSLQEQQGVSSEKPPLKVKAKRLDDVLETIGADVDWIKIDVEGAEIEVLQGLEKTLKKNHPKLIIESWRPNQKKVRKLMEKFGYTIRLMPSPTYCYLYYMG